MKINITTEKHKGVKRTHGDIEGSESDFVRALVVIGSRSDVFRSSLMKAAMFFELQNEVDTNSDNWEEDIKG